MKSKGSMLIAHGKDHILLNDIRIRVSIKSTVAVFLLNTSIAVFLSIPSMGKGFLNSFIFSQCIGMMIFFSQNAGFLLLKPARLAVQVIIVLFSILFGTISGSAAGTYLIGGPIWGSSMNGYLTSLLPTLFWGLLFGSIISYIFISREQISRSRAMIMEERIKGLSLENRSMESELKLLQSQTEPHFLFNSLSNVMSLIDEDPQKAKNMLRDFIDFFRMSVSIRTEDLITVGEEIEMAMHYLDVMKMRMGERLKTTVEIQPGIANQPIPPLLIQPLVENAVKHGLEPQRFGGHIHIQGARDGDTIRITVSDTGAGINTNHNGKGIGLSNIRKRLELLYGQRGKLSLLENTPSGVHAVIEVPGE